MAPDWLLTTLWFAAGVFGTGAFWFFLGSHNSLGVAFSACGALGSVALAVWVHVRNDSLRRRHGVVPVQKRLLAFVWSYPLAGENQASWAVKESAVLKGQLGTARDEPGLGVAIVTTELALAAFGDSAASRIDRCVRWGLEHSDQQPPYEILAGTREQSSGATVDIRADLRHTLAFGVILARTRRKVTHVEEYVRLAISRQHPDHGGWPADSVATISPIFTAIYAVELLHLAGSDGRLASALRNGALKARDQGIRWVLDSRTSDGLWSSGNLVSFAWDRALATAWVLHRLVQTAELAVPDWNECLQRALLAMTEQALDMGTWVGCSDAQRQRVEARIAAASSRCREMRGLSLATREAVNAYLGMWTDRAIPWANHVHNEDLDVATAAFMVQALARPDELRDWVGSPGTELEFAL